VRRIVLVRHAETTWNAEGRIQGHTGSPLTDRGIAQAERLGAALAEHHPEARLVASDLERTLLTAAPYAAALGREPEPDPALRERAFGAWEGRTRDEVAASDPERWSRWRAGDDAVVGEVGGEGSDELVARILAALERRLAALDDGGVLVAVTHGGPIWFGLQALLGLDAGRLGGVDNASVSELTVEGTTLGDGASVLERWNEVGHLPPALRSSWVVRRGGAQRA
jgi:broad specificity phosphatase PhoE